MKVSLLVVEGYCLLCLFPAYFPSQEEPQQHAGTAARRKTGKTKKNYTFDPVDLVVASICFKCLLARTIFIDTESCKGMVILWHHCVSHSQHRHLPVLFNFYPSAPSLLLGLLVTNPALNPHPVESPPLYARY